MVSLGARAALPSFAMVSVSEAGSLEHRNRNVFRSRRILSEPPDALVEALHAGENPTAMLPKKLRHPACCQQTSTLRKRTDQIEKSLYDLLFSWECCPGYVKLQQKVSIFIMDPFVELFITICIISNTALMILDKPDITEEMTQFLKIGNYVSVADF
ncbi:Sodium channel voltage-gated type [Cichlidogyrus casuarinus]|uniref:Sodium channel voltage-gated type n=1 Tax=Cichlidogyrus casuarinus TaxID=1844966 RepID=A0ABD2PX56_9PLAT